MTPTKVIEKTGSVEPVSARKASFKIGTTIVNVCEFAFACMCGLMVMLMLPGFLAAAVIGLILLIPFGLSRLASRKELHPAVPAFVFVIFYLVPFVAIIQGNHIGSIGEALRVFYELNLKALLAASKPALSICGDIYSFGLDLFGEDRVDLQWVILAKADYNYYVVMAYHFLLILPIMLALFGAGVGIFYSQKGVNEKVLLMLKMVIPAGWVCGFMYRVLHPKH